MSGSRRWPMPRPHRWLSPAYWEEEHGMIGAGWFVVFLVCDLAFVGFCLFKAVTADAW